MLDQPQCSQRRHAIVLRQHQKHWHQPDQQTHANAGGGFGKTAFAEACYERIEPQHIGRPGSEERDEIERKGASGRPDLR
jgi:hypothetical protein